MRIRQTMSKLKGHEFHYTKKISEEDIQKNPKRKIDFRKQGSRVSWQTKQNGEYSKPSSNTH